MMSVCFNSVEVHWEFAWESISWYFVESCAMTEAHRPTCWSELQESHQRCFGRGPSNEMFLQFQRSFQRPGIQKSRAWSHGVSYRHGKNISPPSDFSERDSASISSSLQAHTGDSPPLPPLSFWTVVATHITSWKEQTWLFFYLSDFRSMSFFYLSSFQRSGGDSFQNVARHLSHGDPRWAANFYRSAAPCSTHLRELRTSVTKTRCPPKLLRRLHRAYHFSSN